MIDTPPLERRRFFIINGHNRQMLPLRRHGESPERFAAGTALNVVRIKNLPERQG